MLNKMRFGALALCLAISGCSSVDDEAFQPEPLPEIEQKFDPKALWSNSLDGVGEHFNRLHPVIGYDHVYAADAEGNLAAYNLETGKKAWEIETELALAGGLGLGSNLILAGSLEGDVIAIDAKTGESKWKVKVSSEVVASPAIGDGYVIVRTIDGKIFALDAENGNQHWYFDRVVPALTLRGTSKPVVERGAAIATFANGKIGVFILKNGQLAWEKEISVAKGRSELARMIDADTTPMTLGDTVYTANYSGNLVAISLRSGDTIWQREASTYQDISLDAQLIYLVDDENVLRAYSRSNGTPFWQNDDLKHRELTAPVLFNGYLVVGDYEGYLHWIDPKTGEILAYDQIDSDGIVANPITDGERLVVYTRSGDIEVFSAQ